MRKSKAFLLLPSLFSANEEDPFFYLKTADCAQCAVTEAAKTRNRFSTVSGLPKGQAMNPCSKQKTKRKLLPTSIGGKGVEVFSRGGRGVSEEPEKGE